MSIGQYRLKNKGASPWTGNHEGYGTDGVHMYCVEEVCRSWKSASTCSR